MYVLKNSEEVYMLKFNLTQEGKTAIDALQGNAKLTITKVLLSGGYDSPSKEITSFKGAVCNDGTGNGAYVVIDINDDSTSNYACRYIELFSDQTKIATQCKDEASGYEVTLYCGERGANEYPSVTYRTQTWASKKIPTNIQLSRSMAGEGKQCGINFFGGGANGAGVFDFENGNFPSTITFNNGDVWVTNETVSAAGVTAQADYYASTEMGENAIRPLFSKVLIQKESNKHLKLRISCQFDGAEKCKFNTTSINLPYASKFREGVVRFADPSSVYGTDGQRYNTVYSAADVDAKINQVTESLGNLDQYAKKAEQNEFTAANTFTAGITVNGEIGGTAVTDAGTDGDKHIVNVGYADNKYLSQQAATDTYLTKTDAGTTYLSKADANAAAANYAKLNVGNTFTGATNTFQEVSATKFSGNGVVKSITDNTQDNAELIPTDGAVKAYVDSKVETLNGNVTALQEKDNDLQSQVDGINAGQNLADIVNNTTELAAYDVSHLKAKDDFQHGSSGAKWAIGDKVQVLGGGDTDAQSCVYELIKGTKPEDEANSIQSTNNAAYYWHYIGVYGTNAYTKSEIDGKLDTINNTLGDKADKSYVDTELGKKANSADVYTKTNADEKFAQLAAANTFTSNNTFNGTISGNAVTSDIATDAVNNGERLTTCAGVSNFVTKVVDDKITELQGGMSYLKLNSDKDQTVNSNVAFNGIISGTAVTSTQMTETEDEILKNPGKIVSLGFAESRYANLGDDNVFGGKLNTFQTINVNTISGRATTSQIDASATHSTRLPTESAVATFVDNAITANQNATSDKTKVGAMGLFLYTGNDFKEMGAEVAGTSLKAVGMQLPIDGVVSWSQGAAMEGTWKLLNNTIAGESCLVLAIRTE